MRSRAAITAIIPNANAFILISLVEFSPFHFTRKLVFAQNPWLHATDANVCVEPAGESLRLAKSSRHRSLKERDGQADRHAAELAIGIGLH